MSARLARGGATIDRYYHCPHLADAPLERYRQACRCRKPGPGMIEQACRDLGLDPARSFMVGDRWLDVACGVGAGTRAIRVLTGHGAAEARGRRAGQREGECYPRQFDGGRRLDSSELAALIDVFPGRTVAVIGDVVADEFVYGRVARVSREAPVLILEYDSTEIVPGAGGNAANNVAALGGRASLVSVIGGDDAGRRMLAALHPRVKHTGVTRAAGANRDQDADPGGWNPFRQTAGGADRPRSGPAGRRPRARPLRARRAGEPAGRRCRADVRLRLGPRDAGARAPGEQRAANGPAIRSRC